MSKTTELFRTDIAKGIKEGKQGVDREHGIIRGYAVMTKMKDTRDNRGIEIDDTTLEQIMAIGNKTKIGIKSRFGHPGWSFESLGTFLGRSKNFRIDGDILRADLFLDMAAFKSPNGNLADYIMDLAESDPACFGSSVHMRDFNVEYRMEKDGTRTTDEEGDELPGLLRVKSLWACDIVEEPAANEELFNVRRHGGMRFYTGDLELSAKAAEFLDQFLTNPDAVDKVIGFLERYRANRVVNEEAGNQTKQEGLNMEPDLTTLSLEQLKAGRPDLIDQLSAAVREQFTTEFNQQKESAINQAVSQAITAERARAAGIFKSAMDLADDKLAAVNPLLSAGKKAVEDGLSQDAAESGLKTVKLQLISQAAPDPVGHGSGEDDDAQGKSHLDRAREYALKNKCSITDALQATAPAKKQQAAIASK